MQKILTIARREYNAMVSTKAFLIGLAMMPVLMLGGMIAPRLLSGMERAQDRRIAVVDHTGSLFLPLKLAAEQRTQQLNVAATSTGSADDDADEKTRIRKAMGLEEIHRYVIESVPTESFDDEARLEFSEQIRERSLYAFIEIPAEVVTPAAPLIGMDLQAGAPELPKIAYFAEDAAMSDARRWLDATLNQLTRGVRLAEAVPVAQLPQVMLEVERRSEVVGKGLYSRADDGSIVSGEKPSEMAATLVPMAMMMLMFMIIMMSAQPMLESVLEEKTLRISEVLLGAANAQELMLGKLLGNVAGSLTVFSVYAVGAISLAMYQGYGDLIPFHVLPWFLIYQVLAVLMFSSLFMAIGACVSHLREAQSLLLPVWMVILLPLMVWINVVREPNSTLATGFSFFPPSTSMMMTLRLATGATIPVWQILCSILLLLGGTAGGVTAAARIYRIGILWQGKTPRLNELISWVLRAPG
jgi:ABC-2 type transport system permease protein